MDCFHKMEKIEESCDMFTEKINCGLNATAKECKETKVALVKYCSHSECAGDYSGLLFYSL